MRTVFTATLEFSTDLFVTRKEYHFETQSEFRNFTSVCAGAGIRVIATGQVNVYSAKEVAEEVAKERRVATQVAAGNLSYQLDQIPELPGAASIAKIARS